MGLHVSGPCSCHIVYIHPKDVEHDGGRCFIALNTGSSSNMHDHPRWMWDKITCRRLS